MDSIEKKEKNQTGKDRRHNFRLFLSPPLKATAWIKSIDGHPIPLEKNVPLTILDVSAGGLRVGAHLNLEVAKHSIVLQLDFTFEELDFKIQGQVIRKEGNDTYGIRFIGLTPNDERRLVSCLYNAERRRSRFNLIPNAEHLKSPVLKMLEVIPYPALLLNKDYKIMALNQMAERLGCRAGGICHKVIFDRDSPCAYCKLHASRKIDRLVKLQIKPDKTNPQVAHWLYLNNGLYLHYFRSGEYAAEPPVNPS